VFLTTNITCAVITKLYQTLYPAEATLIYKIIVVRVAINDSLFILVSMCLSFCIYKLAKMAAASVVLEAKVNGL